MVPIGKVQGALRSVGPKFNDGLPGAVKLVGKPQILQLDVAADKLLIELGKRPVKALEKFERRWFQTQSHRKVVCRLEVGILGLVATSIFKGVA